MAQDSESGFDVDEFLANAGPGRKIVQLKRAQVFFSQGDPADCVFFLQKGRVKISVASASGKEATIRLVSANDFFGEKAMEANPGLRVTTATATTACTALRIARPEFLRVMQKEVSVDVWPSGRGGTWMGFLIAGQQTLFLRKGVHGYKRTGYCWHENDTAVPHTGRAPTDC